MRQYAAPSVMQRCIHLLGRVSLPLLAVQAAAADVEALTEGLKARERRFRSLEVRWDASNLYTDQFRNRIVSMPVDDRDNTTSAEFEPTEIAWTGRMIVQGQNRRCEHNRPKWSFPDRCFVQYPNTSVFNGVLATSLVERSHTTIPRQGYLNSRDVVLSDTGHALLLAHVRPFDPQSLIGELLAGSVEVTTVIASDRSLIRVEKLDDHRRKAGLRELAWFDPQQDWSLCRFSVLKNDRPHRDTQAEYLRDSDGHWVPRGWRQQKFDSHGRLALLTRAAVTYAKVNVEFPAETFELVFPEGTLVNDQREESSHREFVILEDRTEVPLSRGEQASARSGTELLQIAKHKAEGRNWFARVPWLLLCGAALSVLLITAFVKRLCRNSK